MFCPHVGTIYHFPVRSCFCGILHLHIQFHLCVRSNLQLLLFALLRFKRNDTLAKRRQHSLRRLHSTKYSVQLLVSRRLPIHHNVCTMMCVTQNTLFMRPAGRPCELCAATSNRYARSHDPLALASRLVLQETFPNWLGLRCYVVHFFFALCRVFCASSLVVAQRCASPRARPSSTTCHIINHDATACDQFSGRSIVPL